MSTRRPSPKEETGRGTGPGTPADEDSRVRAPGPGERSSEMALPAGRPVPPAAAERGNPEALRKANPGRGCSWSPDPRSGGSGPDPGAPRRLYSEREGATRKAPRRRPGVPRGARNPGRGLGYPDRCRSGRMSAGFWATSPLPPAPGPVGGRRAFPKGLPQAVPEPLAAPASPSVREAAIGCARSSGEADRRAPPAVRNRRSSPEPDPPPPRPKLDLLNPGRRRPTMLSRREQGSLPTAE